MLVDNREIAIKGGLFRMARVRNEPYECLDNPHMFLQSVRSANLPADVFTFSQQLFERDAKYNFPLQMDSFALLPVSGYEYWWKKQLNDKTRNMVRKAQKSGVEVRVVDFTDDFVRGIVEIYNESPIIQGKPNRFYGKDFETIKQSLLSFFERSDFFGAYHQNELIGFAKLVHGKQVSSLLHILSKMVHRDKAPTNALIAKAVEICAQKKIPYLHYGVWSRRGLGDFKKHHGFLQFDIPRYFVPLTLKGRLMLKLNLHRKLSDFVPSDLLDRIVLLRNRWNAFRYRRQFLGR